MSVEGSVRDRRRAETVAEIKEAALVQLAEAGTGGLSLRGVARRVGLTVQSLYHYFDSRDALLVALVADGHHAVAGAVADAAEATRGRPARERLQAVTAAFRVWALANPSAFLLLYGTPVPGFDAATAPGGASATGQAAMRLAAPFAEVVFDGWSPAELAAIPLPGGDQAALRAVDASGLPLPVGALALFIELRARMHGLVMLELLGHLHPLDAAGEALLAAAMHRASDDLDALRRRARPTGR